MNVSPGTDCAACGKEIGTESYVVCEDGITHKVVTFHHACMPKMTDVRKHYGVGLAPGRLGIIGTDLN